MSARFDEQEVWTLLEVVRLAGGHPQLVNIKNEAMKALNQINADLGPPPNQANLVAQAASVDNGDPSRNEESPVGLEESQEEPNEPHPEVERRA